MRKQQRELKAVSAGVAWLVTGLAAAQTAAPTAAQTPEAPPALERVEVTAQRRVESVQSVGVAISVLSGDELAARGVTNVNKLQNELPSLEIEPAFGSGQPQFRIRGIGFQDYGSNNASAVSLYVDEVAFGYPVQTQGLLFDLERVEVLRGPQGTLYGKNTTGGAINLITRKPTQTREGGFSLGYGSNQARSAQGYLSGPLSESLRGRLSLATEQGGAWQSNRVTGAKLGDKNIVAVRGQLELDITRDLKAHLSLSHNVDKSDVAGLYLFTARPSYGYAADRDRSKTGWGLAPDFATLVGVGADSAPSRDNSATQVALTLNWDLGATRLTSISSHQRFDRRELGDWDGTPINHSDVFWKDKASITTQELRLASNKTAALNWVLGAYYAKEQLDEDWYTDFRHDFGVITRTKYTQSGKTWALFGQADTLLAPDVKLVAGLRREKEERGLRDFSTTFTNIPGSGLTGLSSSLDTGNTSGKLALEYQVAREQLVYVSLSRGIKSGGITAHNTFDPAALGAFQPEKLNSLELGYKADLNRTLRLNAALFHYDYRNQQFQDVITSNTGALVGKIVNIPRSEVRGPRWRGGTAVAPAGRADHRPGPWLQARHFQGLQVGAAGRSVGPRSIPAQAQLWRQRRLRLEHPGLCVQAGGRLQLPQQVRVVAEPPECRRWQRLRHPGLLLANARLEVSKAGAPWQLSLLVQNLFDRRYDLTRNFFGNRPATQDDLNVAAAGQPRSVGVTLSYDF